ncbi:MAG TPA: caspase family protein [Blastocatellia bacterium]|nr:caspase family protein [Blastocatellia bacterium]
MALVIGNNSYETSPLVNPVNDAKDMTQALREVKFDVTQKTNATLHEMKAAVQAFGAQMSSGGVGLFYFAGHAVQVNGRNYLIPIDARISKESEVADAAIDISQVLAQMQPARNAMTILILDACRNNPFAAKNRNFSKNFAPMEAPPGTLIAFATAPGAEAWDGRGRNSIYTRELLRAMRTAGLGIEDVFKTVRASVQKQSQGRQTPWEFSSLTRDFFFRAVDENWTEGMWEGMAYQAARKTAWPLKLIVQNQHYWIEYPSLTCAGELTLTQRKNGQATFREKTVRRAQQCEGGGEIVLEKVNDAQLVFKYFNPQTNEIVASAILNKKEFKAQVQSFVPAPRP